MLLWYNRFVSGGGCVILKRITARNTLTNDTYEVSDEIKSCLLEIDSKYKYYYESKSYTRLFIPIDHDDGYGHTYEIQNKLYETLYTNPISELEKMKPDTTEIQLSFF